VRSAWDEEVLVLPIPAITESVLLSGMGGLLGLAISYLGAHALLAIAFPDQQNMPVTASPSPLIIGFALVISLVTGF
jgi:macrolide transport system ATP-binding/permease protein